jgi:Na+-translocating ferredoxin:NAD+ oxidoreductase RNF subunit RnfB
MEAVVVIVVAVGVLGGLGLVLGSGLAVASVKLAVKRDPLVEQIVEALPSANCGACGYAGCSAFAEAVVAGTAPPNACVPGGESCAQAVAAILGVEVEAKATLLAKIRCRGSVSKATDRYSYSGVSDCAAAMLVQGGPKSCRFGCLGLGTCAVVCPFDAIRFNGPGTIPEIDIDLCTACGRCVEECPVQVIDLVPAGHTVHVVCNSLEKGKAVRAICSVGCIACKACEKVCPFDAIHVIDNLAVMDYDKCTQCGLCTEKCPTNCIEGQLKAERAIINEDCIGCTACAKVCPVDAISGEKKEQHVVDRDKCIGCGVCVTKCPPKANAIRLE